MWFEEGPIGDQWKTGFYRNPLNLINPKSYHIWSSTLSKKNQHWFLPWTDYEDFLKKWISRGVIKTDWKPIVYGQCNLGSMMALKATGRNPRLGIGNPCSCEAVEGKGCMFWFDAPL